MLGGEAVELERIEILVALIGFTDVAGGDLGFGFDIQTAKLLAQTRGGLIKFDQIGLELAELLFETGTVDRDLTGEVDQLVEQVGADTDHVLRRAQAFIGIEILQIDRAGQRFDGRGGFGLGNRLRGGRRNFAAGVQQLDERIG